MNSEELGHLSALRNLLHGAPTSQARLAWRLRKVDELLTRKSPRFRLTREPDYWEIAGKWLDRDGESE